MERREYTRLTVALTASLRAPDGQQTFGIARDISFGGVYLEAGDPAAVAAELPVRGCELTLRLGSATGAPAVVIQCDLVDLGGSRLGLRFTGASEADFELLRDHLLTLAPDPAALRREFEEMPNLAFTAPLLPSFQRWLERMLARLRG